MAVTTKWICPSCTYYNFPSSARCILCSCSKPTDLHLVPRPSTVMPRHKNNHLGGSGLSRLPVSPASSGHFAPGGATISSDMIIDPDNVAFHSRLSSVPFSQREGGRGRGDHTGSMGAQSKWICSVCTFDNWPNSNHCSMCNTPKSRHKPAVLSVSKEASRTMSAGGGLGASILDYAPSCVGAVGGMAHLPEDMRVPSHVRDSPPNRPLKSKSSKKSSSDNRLQKKWKCQKCTYENWSRASKCVMCQSPKIKTPSPPLSDSESSQSPNPSHSLHFPPSSSSSSTSLPTDNANSSPSSTHPRGHGINSNEAAATSIHTEAASPAVRLIPCVSDEAAEIYPSRKLKSNSDEVRQIRNRLSSSDWLFINACLGVVNDDNGAVKAYLKYEGDRARQLSSDECLVLGEPSTFTVGSTLVHLAVRFQRSDILSLLLTPAPSEARKRLPSQSNPDLATSIREEVDNCLRQHKGDWPCYFLTHLCTFTLPAEIRRFCVAVQKRVLDGIVDREVEKELEEGTPIINWSSELVEELGSYLYPLWNRTAGDCLLDSVLQATWGVVDRDGTLRRALADSLVDGASLFYKRWKEAEQRQAHAQGFSLDEEQLLQDWAAVLALADQRRKSLEQIHIFALAHILRRPIVVYGVKVVKNFRGENLGLANFEGLYLPLIWETSFCSKSPLALAYTRGHFSALVSMPPSQTNRMGAWSNQSGDGHMTHLPLVDSEGRQLPIHFISEEEMGCEDRLLKQYCDCRVTRMGTLTAVQEAGCPHSLVTQLVDEWLDRYRRMDKRRDTTACNYDSDS